MLIVVLIGALVAEVCVAIEGDALTAFAFAAFCAVFIGTGFLASH